MKSKRNTQFIVILIILLAFALIVISKVVTEIVPEVRRTSSVTFELEEIIVEPETTTHVSATSENEVPQNNEILDDIIAQSSPIMVQAKGGNILIEPTFYTHSGELSGYTAVIPLDHPVMLGARDQYAVSHGKVEGGRITFRIEGRPKEVSVSADGRIISYFDSTHQTVFRDEVTQVCNQWYTGDKYHIQQRNNDIRGKNLRTGEVFSVDLNSLCTETPLGRSDILEVMMRLPGEVLHDMSVCVNYIIHQKDDELRQGKPWGGGGYYGGDGRVYTSSNLSTLVHEIGHAVHDHSQQNKGVSFGVRDEDNRIWAQTNVSSTTQGIGTPFYKAFSAEQAAYAKNKRLVVDGKYVSGTYRHHMQNTNEMFAYCYEIIMTNGNFHPDEAFAGEEAQKATITAFVEYLRNIRKLPIGLQGR